MACGERFLPGCVMYIGGNPEVLRSYKASNMRFGRLPTLLSLAHLDEAKRFAFHCSLLSESDISKASAMLSDPNITKKEVAEHFAVSQTTLNSSLARINNG